MVSERIKKLIREMPKGENHVILRDPFQEKYVLSWQKRKGLYFLINPPRS